MEWRQLVEQNMVKQGQLRNMRVGTLGLPLNAPANVRVLKILKARPEATGQGIEFFEAQRHACRWSKQKEVIARTEVKE